jgi:ER lumen protein retaining receptor
MMLTTQGHGASVNSKAPLANTKVILTYVVFFMGAVTLYNALSAGFSSFLTLGAGFQCLGFVLLAMKVQNQRATTGLSGKMLAMYALTLCFRLSSTVHLNGYLPVDQTGDWAYQVIEVCSLALIGYLMRCTFVTHRSTYQEQHDSFPLTLQNMLMGCFILAVMVHPNLDRWTFFDIMWTTGCYLETLSMLPQLWMLSKIGEVEALASHFVVLSVLSRVCSLIFWYRGFAELAPAHGGFNFSGWGVMGAHVAQLLLSCDFVFLYLKSFNMSKMVLPNSYDV